MSIEKKIYSSWAFKANEKEMKDMNLQIYEENRSRAVYVISRMHATEEQMKTKLVYRRQGQGYANEMYEVLSNPENLPGDMIALLIDHGNLCFGYRIEIKGCENPVVIIYTD